MTNLTLNELQLEAYRRYQLDWMISHNRSPRELVQSIIEFIQCEVDPDDPDENQVTNIKPDEEFESWEGDSGFNGAIWVCYNEFLQAEFQDENYMKALLTPAQFRQYQAFKPEIEKYKLRRI